MIVPQNLPWEDSCSINFVLVPDQRDANSLSLWFFTSKYPSSYFNWSICFSVLPGHLILAFWTLSWFCAYKLYCQFGRFQLNGWSKSVQHFTLLDNMFKLLQGQSGMKAVDTSMSQSAIKDVRIVEFARDTLYWFKVSASHRGQVKKLPRNLSSSVLYPDQEENLPAWVRSQEQLFINFTDNLERDKSEFTRLRELDDSMEDLQYKAKSWTSRGAFDLAWRYE